MASAVGGRVQMPAPYAGTLFEVGRSTHVAVMGTFATFHLRTARRVGIADIPQEPPAILKVTESAITPASFPIEKVDDAGLLEMLKDQPVALAALPNGERRLMMIVQAPRGAEL